MPTGRSARGEVIDAEAHSCRNATFDALRKEFSLTQNDFAKKALALRRDSKWIGDHVPSSSSVVHARQVWESFAAHLFRSAGPPKIPRPHESRVLQGHFREFGRGAATNEELESSAARGRKPPKARNGFWTGISLRTTKDGRFNLRLHPSSDRSRRLVIPVVTSAGVQTSREAWYLSDPTTWRQVKIVRRQVRGHFVYEMHLLCAKEPYRDKTRYAKAPKAVVGVDMGVSTMAAVGIGRDGAITHALLVRATPEELEHRRSVARKRRRTQRALERSRRATNPNAYRPDRHGRAGRGSQQPGVRLTTSKAYRAKQRGHRDEWRCEREARVITTNRTAIAVVQRCGTNIITEDVVVKAWQRTWGRSLSYFAPSELSKALKREARLAGGSFTKVPCRIGLTQTCHCGAIKAKRLAERWHKCDVCGSGIKTLPVDRDLHSAYLAAFVATTSSPIASTLDTDRALAAWLGAEAPLVAVSGHPQLRKTNESHLRGTSSWSRRKASDRTGRAIASDVDPDSPERGEDSLLSDVGVGKAHADRPRYEASSNRSDNPLRLDKRPQIT
jgi:transposase